MTRAQLIGTLSSLVELLQHCGHADRAAWLQERKLLLEGVSATAAERDHARRELHQSLSGLDGLFDLRLKPHPRSPYTAKMANGLKNRFANQLGELTKPAPQQFAWHVDAVTPDQIGSAITDWFNQAGSAGLKLPDGWFGRTNDHQFRLTHATVADGIVVVALDDGGLLTVCTPVRVEDS